MITSFLIRETPEAEYSSASSPPKLFKWWEKKEQIQHLRRQGFSYREIMAQLSFKVAKGTVSRWCKEIELTSKQLDRLDHLKQQGWYRNRLLGSKKNQHRRTEEVEAIKAEARVEIGSLTQKELWLSGLMLYWAEGSKAHSVCLTNSDPRLVRFMMFWFREFCKVPEEKFKARLHIHSGQDDVSMKGFWSEITRIPLSQFGKSYVKKEGTGHRKNVLYQGTIQVVIGNKDLLHKIFGWIEGFSKQQFASVAQSVEQLPLKEKVPSSILGGGTTLKRVVGHVAELEDARDLGSRPERGGGSTPITRSSFFTWEQQVG